MRLRRGAWILLVPAAPTLAEARPTLALTAPAGCPSAPDLEAELERLLGRSFEAAAPADFEADVEALESSDAWRVRISLGSARREIDGASCEAVVRAAAVVLGLAIDPDAVAERMEEAPAPEASAVEAAEPAPPPAVASAHPAPQTRAPAWVWGLGAEAGGGLGPVPGPHLALAGAGSLSRGRFRVDLAILWSGASTTAAGTGVGGRFDLVSAAAAACLGLLPHGPVARACAGIEAGAIRGAGTGVSEPHSATADWIAPGASGAIGWPLSRSVVVGARLVGLVPLRRPRFVVDDVRLVHRPSPVAGRATVGLEWLFR